jgi:hypothetical protein
MQFKYVDYGCTGVMLHARELESFISRIHRIIDMQTKDNNEALRQHFLPFLDRHVHRSREMPKEMHQDSYNDNHYYCHSDTDEAELH